jgi:hypothetical protein
MNMTLDNLLKTGQLKEHATTPEEVRQLRAAIRRNLADAKVTAVSDETRFDAAYKAIMQLAMVALLVNGFRPGASSGGHHMTMIQSLPKSVGLPKQTMIVLDDLRRKRNAADYLGSYVDKASVETAIAEGEALRALVDDWSQNHRPALLDD